MPEAIVIRPAVHADLDNLVDLLATLSPIEGDSVVDSGRQRRGLEMMLNNGRGRILAAVAADGTVVGMCTGHLTISTAEGGPAVLVEDIVVHGDWRDQGIRERLMNELHVWVRINEAGRLQLLADRGNRNALDFYAGIGWQQTQSHCLQNRL